MVSVPCISDRFVDQAGSFSVLIRCFYTPSSRYFLSIRVRVVKYTVRYLHYRISGMLECFSGSLNYHFRKVKILLNIKSGV